MYVITTNNTMQYQHSKSVRKMFLNTGTLNHLEYYIWLRNLIPFSNLKIEFDQCIYVSSTSLYKPCDFSSTHF
ncbi:unnamed protein product [Schistosoma turkestanicum]|nr:unnamed protein product [Schistosoma turkestanicum]